MVLQICLLDHILLQMCFYESYYWVCNPCFVKFSARPCIHKAACTMCQDIEDHKLLISLPFSCICFKKFKWCFAGKSAPSCSPNSSWPSLSVAESTWKHSHPMWWMGAYFWLRGQGCCLHWYWRARYQQEVSWLFFSSRRPGANSLLLNVHYCLLSYYHFQDCKCWWWSEWETEKEIWVFFLLGSLLEFTTLAHYELTMWYVDVISVSCFFCWFWCYFLALWRYFVCWHAALFFCSGSRPLLSSGSM